MSLRWAVVALAACGGNATGPSSRASSRRAAGPVCITPPEDVATIRHAATTGTRVQYCVGNTTECFALDVSTGVFERTEVPTPSTADGARIELTPNVEVCLGTACTPLTPKPPPSGTTLRGATNSEGSFAVILVGDATNGGHAEVWDVAKAKRSTTFRYARGDFRCGDVSMLDATTIYLNAIQCGQPAARGGLYRLDGRKIANVGGRDFGTYGGAFLRVEGSTWAFLEESGSQLVLQDIGNGKILKTIDTSLLFKSGGATMGNPGESALVRFADGKLGVIAGSPALGSVATVDVKTGELAIVPAPVCAQPGAATPAM